MRIHNLNKMDEQAPVTDEEIEKLIEDIKEHKIPMGFWNLSKRAVVVPIHEFDWFNLVSAVQTKAIPNSFRDSCSVLCVQVPDHGFFIFHRRAKGDRKGKSPELDKVDSPTEFK